jgi:hypothetical protein
MLRPGARCVCGAACSRSFARSGQALGRSAAADALPLEAALLHLDTDFELHRLSHRPGDAAVSRPTTRRVVVVEAVSQRCLGLAVVARWWVDRRWRAQAPRPLPDRQRASRRRRARELRHLLRGLRDGARRRDRVACTPQQPLHRRLLNLEFIGAERSRSERSRGSCIGPRRISRSIIDRRATRAVSRAGASPVRSPVTGA